MSPATLESRMEHLALANYVRINRAALKRRIHDGELSVIDVLLDPPGYAQGMRIGELLRATPKVGRVKSERCLAYLGAGGRTPLTTLSPRRRQRLIEALQQRCPWVYAKQQALRQHREAA